MPTKSTKSTPRTPGQFNVYPTAAKARAAERESRRIRDLSDISTLKHPKREHQANFELFDARKALVSASKAPWRHTEAGRVLFIKKLVEAGRFSDFPGLHQRDGIAITEGLMAWRNALAATEQPSE